MLLSMMLVFTACEDDRDSNPTLVQPTGFTLNNPVNNNVDLNHSTSIPFTWSQPDYGGWPAAVEYQFEVSPTDKWTISVAQAKADESGLTMANYDVVKGVFAGCSGDLSAVQLAKALVRIQKWTEDSVIPDEMTVYLRLSASTPGAQTIYSNVLPIKVRPYYINADEVYDVWYLIGDCIGDGSWHNDGVANVGESLIPMYPAYDTDGTFMAGSMYVGYFPEGGQFKFVHIPGSWDEQLNYDNIKDPGNFLEREEKDQNIIIKEEGYYTILINSDGEITIEKYEKEPELYEMIYMPGSYQETAWSPLLNPMSAVSTMDGSQNHDWFIGMTFGEDAEVQFAADPSDETSWWGGSEFPYGMGAVGGDKIKVTADKYYIFFNDIMGTYTFIIPATE